MRHCVPHVAVLTSHLWSAYILICEDGTLYTGVSNNVAKRVDTHNRGKGAKYTKSRLPVTLGYVSPPLTKGEALRLEHQIKKFSRVRKLRLIAGDKLAKKTCCLCNTEVDLPDSVWWSTCPGTNKGQSGDLCNQCHVKWQKDQNRESQT